MQTQEKSLISFLTGAGNLNKDVLKADTERLTAWYYDHGYVTVRVDEPKVERHEGALAVMIHIQEGAQFTVGKVAVEGKDVQPTPEAVLASLATKAGEVFERSEERRVGKECRL